MLWALPRTTAGSTTMGTLPRKNSDASSVDVVTDGFTLSQYRQELDEREALKNLRTEPRIDYTSFGRGDNYSEGERSNDINPFSGEIKQEKPTPKEFFHRNNNLRNWGERMFEQYRVDAPCTPPETSGNYQYSNRQLEEMERLRREEAAALEAAKREVEAQKKRAEERAIAAREVAEIQAKFRAERARRRKLAVERRRAKHDSKQLQNNLNQSSSSKQSAPRPVLESLRQAAAEQNQPILQFGQPSPAHHTTSPSVAQDSASSQAESSRGEDEESIRSDSCYSRDEKAYPGSMRGGDGDVREPVFKSFVRRPLSESKDEEMSIQLHLGNRSKSGGTCAQNCNVFGCATM
mmetsp:Transcript_18304/g.29189  ORF Transcript_18304/g.29189 Transcript_18304/m.29189 type:complete len:349 (+) Transcript_18304:205-1251(+)